MIKAMYCTPQHALRLCDASQHWLAPARLACQPLSDNSAWLVTGRDEPVHVAMIWAHGMEAAYDLKILERPELHESVLAADARQRQGPPTHTLLECVDVRTWLEAVVAVVTCAFPVAGLGCLSSLSTFDGCLPSAHCKYWLLVGKKIVQLHHLQLGYSPGRITEGCDAYAPQQPVTCQMLSAPKPSCS